MRKLLALLLVLVMTLGAVHAMAEPEAHMGEILPDFKAATLDGSTFTLSESLRNHDLVLINLWATWCGPCRMEFPYLEQAWEQYGSRVDVIALSIEETDTPEVLRSFADEYGMRFAVGRDEANLFDWLGGSAIPTTVIVNKERRIVAVEIGSKPSTKAFTELFDSLLSQIPAAEAPQDARLVLCFRDPAGNPIPGVTVGFCNGEYIPMETGADGRVAFDGDPYAYHVHLLEVPEGYDKPWEQINVYGTSFDLTVTLRRK